MANVERPILPSDGGTGTSTAPTSGQVAIGTSSGIYAPATISSGTNITVTGGSGTLSIGLSGTVGVGNGGTGLSSTPANGQIDIGNGAGFTRTTLTAGTGISIANASGSITISATAGGTVNSGSATQMAVYSSGGTTLSGLYGLYPAVSTITGTTSLSATSNSIQEITSSSSTYTVTLPRCNTCPGKVFIIAFLSTGSPVNIAWNSNDVMQGANNLLNTALNAYGQTLVIMSDGQASGNWIVLSPALTLSNSISGGYTNGGEFLIANSTISVGQGGTGLTATPTNGQIDIGNGSGFTRTTLTAGTGISIANASGSITISATGSGTVTSVGLSAPSVFSVSGSPVTTSGTLALTFASGQTANQFLATPNGSTGAVGLRAIVAADLPIIPVANGGTGINASSFTAETSNFTAVAGTAYSNAHGNMIITLPTAVGITGQSIYYLVTVAATTIVNTTSSQTVAGFASGALEFTSTSGQTVFVEFQSDGANWQVPCGIGNATITGTQIASNTVANANLSNMANNTVKGNISGSTGAPSDLSASQLQTLVGLSALKASRIFTNGRQLPASGSISGTYWHNGNYTSTGTLTAAHNTRIYCNGTFTATAGSGIVVSTNLVGGAGAASLTTLPPQEGAGIGCGSNGWAGTGSSVVGGAGGGSGGAGGNGGSATAHQQSYGGQAYTWADQFCGSSGSGGGITSASGTGGSGGNGGGGFYLEATGNINATITANGGTGGNASVNGGGGGGGGAGAILVRGGGTLAGTWTANGGNGGNGFSTTGGQGAGGGGGMIDAVSAGTSSVTTSVTGGSVGTGSSTQAATTGSSGTANITASSTPVSVW